VIIDYLSKKRFLRKGYVIINYHSDNQLSMIVVT